jgi:hypothetical protein
MSVSYNMLRFFVFKRRYLVAQSAVKVGGRRQVRLNYNKPLPASPFLEKRKIAEAQELPFGYRDFRGAGDFDEIGRKDIG